MALKQILCWRTFRRTCFVLKNCGRVHRVSSLVLGEAPTLAHAVSFAPMRRGCMNLSLAKPPQVLCTSRDLEEPQNPSLFQLQVNFPPKKGFQL